MWEKTQGGAEFEFGFLVPQAYGNRQQKTQDGWVIRGEWRR